MAEWRSEWPPDLCITRGSAIITGEEQPGVAKVACLRKCRYGPRTEFSPRQKGEAQTIGPPNAIHMEREKDRTSPIKRKGGIKVNRGPRGGYLLRSGQPSGAYPKQFEVPGQSMDSGGISA